MDGKTAKIVGAAAAAIAAGPGLAQAAPAQEAPVPVANSYAELLQPVPNALERLKLANAEADSRPVRLIRAQYAVHDHHHHHHHHHHSRRWYMRHGYYFYGGRWVIRPARDHHHHHHHHNHDHNHY